MNIGNIQLSKGFFITIVVIVAFYFLLPALLSKSAIDREETAVKKFQKGLSAHYQKVMQSAERLVIPDKQFHQCIMSAAKDRARIPPGNSGSISDVNELELLSCFRQDIQSLQGVEQLSKLRFLDVSYNAITSLQPLLDHPGIENLNIKGNPLTSIDELASLPRLSNVQLPRLSQIPCDEIKALLQGVRNDHKRSGCRSNQSLAKKNTVQGQWQAAGEFDRSDNSKPLTAAQERELFEYEMRNR